MKDDVISRQAAIDILDAYQVMVENGEGKPYEWARLRMSELPSVQPDNDHIWNELSKVYNMDSVPDEAKSIIGDVMLGLGEQPDHAWHECFDDDPASFPDNERNVLVSFLNFSLSTIGQWRVDEDGSGCWYLGDTDETFLSEDLYVDGWWELPKKPERRE